MNNSTAGQSRFTEFIDGLLLDAVRKGLTSFDKILLSLPGVYPSAALVSLERLAFQGKIPQKLFLDAIRLTSDKQCRQMTHSFPECAATRRVLLPVPHPLDYDWRF
jgi:hypothetical protein